MQQRKATYFRDNILEALGEAEAEALTTTSNSSQAAKSKQASKRESRTQTASSETSRIRHSREPSRYSRQQRPPAPHQLLSQPSAWRSFQRHLRIHPSQELLRRNLSVELHDASPLRGSSSRAFTRSRVELVASSSPPSWPSPLAAPSSRRRMAS